MKKPSKRPQMMPMTPEIGMAAGDVLPMPNRNTTASTPSLRIVKKTSRNMV